MDDAPIGIADALAELGQTPSPDTWRRVIEQAWPVVASPCHRIAAAHGDDAVQEALLHVRTGARRFRPRSADRDADARRIMAWTTAYQEAVVRRKPEQWVWWHRRWRTRPPEA